MLESFELINTKQKRTAGYVICETEEGVVDMAGVHYTRNEEARKVFNIQVTISVHFNDDDIGGLLGQLTDAAVNEMEAFTAEEDDVDEEDILVRTTDVE